VGGSYISLLAKLRASDTVCKATSHGTGEVRA
jgi:hypothetical protein